MLLLVGQVICPGLTNQIIISLVVVVKTMVVVMDLSTVSLMLMMTAAMDLGLLSTSLLSEVVNIVAELMSVMVSARRDDVSDGVS